MFKFWSLCRKRIIFLLNEAQVLDRSRATKPGSVHERAISKSECPVDIQASEPLADGKQKQIKNVCSPITEF